jgi:ligand-binding sensor domain-containing protein
MQKLSQNLFICIFLVISMLEFTTCKKDDKTDSSFTKSGFVEIEKTAVSGKPVNSILVDDAGYKWIGGDAGLFLFTNSNWYEYDKLKDTKIFSINKHNNNILISTSVGVYSFSSKTSSVSLSEILTGSDYGGVSDTVYVYSIDKYGNIWLSSPDGLSFNNGTGWVTNSQININLGGLEEIRSITFRNNEVFFSTYGRFLYHLKLQEVNFDAVSGASHMIGGAQNPINNFNGQLTTDTIFCVYAASDSTLWFGSKDGLTGNKGNTHVSSGDFQYYLRGERIRCILETSDKKIWAGSENGVFMKNGDSWIKYTTSDGLPGNIITSISEDVDNSLWISTDKGIVHYVNGQFINP